MDKCAHYHLALLNVMNAFDPKINSIQGYTTEVINQRIEDYLALIIKNIQKREHHILMEL